MACELLNKLIILIGCNLNKKFHSQKIKLLTSHELGIINIAIHAPLTPLSFSCLGEDDAKKNSISQR